MAARTPLAAPAAPVSAPAVPAPRAAAPRWQVWTALGIVYVIWGSTYLAIAIAVQTLPPLSSAGVRFLIAGAVMYAALALRHGVARVRVTRAQVVGAAVVGTALLCGGNGLVMIAERDVPSGLTALIIAVVPLWVVLYRALAGDRPPRETIAASAVGFAGVAVLVLPRGTSGEVAIGAMLLLVGATASWAWGSFYSRRTALPRDPLVSTALQMLCGSIALLLAGVMTGEAGALDASRYSTDSLLAMAYLVVFGSLVAFTAYTWLLQHAPISTVATYAYVNPVVAVALGSLVLAEPITGSMLVGAAIILAAVAFIVSREERKPAN